MAMLICRGITSVNAMELSRAVDASISGIAGIGHIMTGVGLILYLVMAKNAVKKK